MKGWLKLLNDTKVDLSEYKEEKLNDIDKRKLKKALKKRIIKKKSNNTKKVAIASMTILSLMAITNLEVIASKLEKIISGNPIENFESYKGVSGDGYRNVVEQKVTNNGLTITINEVIFDYKDIVINYTMTGNNINIEDISIDEPKIFIDGKEIKAAGYSGTYSNKDENLKQVVLEPREDIEKIDEFDMKIVIGGKGDFTEDKIIEDGKWEFNFRASNLKMKEATKTFNLDKKIALSNGTNININKAIVTPISTVVEFEVFNIPEKDLEKLSLDCIVEDSKGNVLDSIGNHYGYSIDKGGYGSARFRNIDENIENIKITPIVLFNTGYHKNNVYNKELKEHAIKIDINK